MPLAEGAERVLRLLELVRAVDDRRDRAALEQLGERPKIRIAELRNEEARLAEGCDLHPNDVGERPEKGSPARRTDHDNASARSEHPSQLAPGAAAGDVDHEVIPVSRAREVLVRVV